MRNFRIRDLLQFMHVLNISAICCGIILGEVLFSNVGKAQATTIHNASLASVTCPTVTDPTSNSLLLVLLDRSGSLIGQPGATDPNGYSTSVTNALADLWPGSMAVVPFSNNQTPILGPATLSDPRARADLKHSVNSYPIGGNTPLGPAMHQALKLLRGAAPGSRVIVVTDGNPTGDGNNDGAHQEKDIRSNLIPQFCANGIPINVLGLSINPATVDGQDANRLLTDIAIGTGATYSNVSSPESLAKVVINLYAAWRHLTFSQARAPSNNFPISIDSFVEQATIITFRSDKIYSITLFGPNNQPVRGETTSVDTHYIIDTLGPGTFVAGSYTLNTSNDPNAQVYILIKSQLRVQIISPTSAAIIYVGNSIQIEAAFFNGNGLLTPEKNQAQVVAQVTLVVNGQQVGPTNDIFLVQQGAHFKGQTLKYGLPGTVQIVISANYHGTDRTTILQLRIFPSPPSGSSPCQIGLIQCFWQFNGQQVLIITSMILILLTLLFRSNQPEPYGWLHDIRYLTNEVQLGKSRPFLQRIFHTSVIRSDELENHNEAYGGFSFGAAKFDLVFKAGRKVYIRQAKGNASQIIIKTKDEGKTLVDKKGVFELKQGSIINIDGRDVASFEETWRGRWLSDKGRSI